MIAAVTAGGKQNRFRVNCVLIPLVILGLNSGHNTVIDNEFSSLSVQLDFDSALLSDIVKRLHETSASAHCCKVAGDAFFTRLGNVELRADVVDQPVDRGR